MSRQSRLRRLDDSIVPVVSGRLRGFVAGLRGGSRWTMGVRHVVDDQPALAASIAAVLVAGMLLGVAGDRTPGDGNAASCAVDVAENVTSCEPPRNGLRSGVSSWK